MVTYMSYFSEETKQSKDIFIFCVVVYSPGWISLTRIYCYSNLELLMG